MPGAARNEDVSRMLRRGAFKEAAMNTVPYFWRAPTHSNIADGPSRLRFELCALIGAQRVRVDAAMLCDLALSGK